MKKLFIAAFVAAAAGVFAQQPTAPDGFVRIEGGTFTMGSPANEAERDSAGRRRSGRPVRLSGLPPRAQRVGRGVFPHFSGKKRLTFPPKFDIFNI